MALAAISYEVQIANLHAHLFSVSLTIERPTALQKLSLPVWIPGSYLVREFSKNLQQLQARQLGKLLTITQLDKCSWQIQCTEGKPLVLSYQIYAFDSSVRTAWLDATRGFFNPSGSINSTGNSVPRVRRFGPAAAITTFEPWLKPLPE